METLETLTVREIQAANLTEKDADMVRNGILSSLEILVDSGFATIDSDAEITFDLRVHEFNRESLTAVVRDTIQSLSYL